MGVGLHGGQALVDHPNRQTNAVSQRFGEPSSCLRGGSFGTREVCRKSHKDINGIKLGNNIDEFIEVATVAIGCHRRNGQRENAVAIAAGDANAPPAGVDRYTHAATH